MQRRTDWASKGPAFLDGVNASYEETDKRPACETCEKCVYCCETESASNKKRRQAEGRNNGVYAYIPRRGARDLARGDRGRQAKGVSRYDGWDWDSVDWSGSLKRGS